MSIAPAIAFAGGDAVDDDERYESLEQRVAALEAENQELRSNQDALADSYESFTLAGLIPAVGDSRFGLGPAASKVYSVEDLVEHETEAAIKAAGKLRVEGRDYVMREGDVCHFLIGK